MYFKYKIPVWGQFGPLHPFFWLIDIFLIRDLLDNGHFSDGKAPKKPRIWIKHSKKFRPILNHLDFSTIKRLNHFSSPTCLISYVAFSPKIGKQASLTNASLSTIDELQKESV